MPLHTHATPTGLAFFVKVVPNASRDQIVGLLGDRLKVKVAQPPEDGKANRALENLLAGALNFAAGRVRVVAGHSQPLKTVEITGDPAAILASLAALLAQA